MPMGPKYLLGAQIPLGDQPLSIGPKYLLWTKSLWVQNPYFEDKSLAVVPQVFLEGPNTLKRPNFAWESQPLFDLKSLLPVCDAQAPCGAQIPFTGQPLLMGPKTPCGAQTC